MELNLDVEDEFNDSNEFFDIVIGHIEDIVVEEEFQVSIKARQSFNTS